MSDRLYPFDQSMFKIAAPGNHLQLPMDLITSAAAGLTAAAPTAPFPTFGTIRVREELRTAFRAGLWDAWWTHFGDRLFDPKDLALARSQAAPRPKGCGAFFFEWLSAILVFHLTGYHSLQSKYDRTSDGQLVRKRPTFERLAGRTVFDFIDAARARGCVAGCPDLVAFKPDYSDWFFIDAKGPDDSLRGPQTAWWRDLSAFTKKPVYLMPFGWAR